ncbi:hypothetical protein QEM15_001673 [Pseudomonas putida]|nr:hypothetical protein [Pseudomonas putida]
MDLKVTWWNCHLSAPATRAKPGKVAPNFVTAILNLLDDGVDLLCLCEVNEDNCRDLAAYISAAGVIDPKYALFQVESLYSKDGNKIDDYGLIYRRDKLSLTSPVIDLNAVSDVTGKHLKVGRKVGFKLCAAVDIWVILCHWQSLRTYTEDSHIRTEIARELRGYVKDIYDSDPDALIVICGDFNDEPFSRSIQMALKASRDISYVKTRSDALFNPFWRLVGTTDLVAGTHLPVGTCASPDAQYLTNWRTFDQIILSSGFLRGGWSFVGSGVEIISWSGITGNAFDWSGLSDHYPISCNLKRVV